MPIILSGGLYMKTVLIVDDAAFMRVSIKNTLAKNGFSVIGEAENGRVGLQKYKDLKPDVVTMDITMPEMDGLESLKEILAFDPGANVIMITAMGQESMVREAILLGAKGFIVKPFKESTILSALTGVQ
jgi:two-component system chemotaxis response regulator CheY